MHGGWLREEDEDLKGAKQRLRKRGTRMRRSSGVCGSTRYP
jgi:hypothetical protein